MSKKLKEIQNKLNKYPISSFSKEEIELYFDHRLQNLLLSKKVLFRNELEYLLGETGPGNLRIEPDLFRLLVDKGSFVQSPFESIPEIKKLKTLKKLRKNTLRKISTRPKSKNCS